MIKGSPDTDLRYGKSLLEEIPENRSCKSIPISDHWCGCKTSTAVKNLTLIQPMSEAIVRKVNQIISDADTPKKCVELSFKKTLSAFEQTIKGRLDLKSDSQTKYYLIEIEVKPSNALFEATVNYNAYDNQMEVGPISRLDYYGNQSHCVARAFLKLYCFCSDLIKS